MKQMIKNWKTIESLEDFIYFDKETGKIKLKKDIDGIATKQELEVCSKIFITEDDFNDINDIDFNNVKIGDFIFSTSEQLLCTVIYKDSDQIKFKNIDTDMVSLFYAIEVSYIYDTEQEKWVYDTILDFDLSQGTKLYKHTITLKYQMTKGGVSKNKQTVITAISTYSEPISNSSAKYYALHMNTNKLTIDNKDYFYKIIDMVTPVSFASDNTVYIDFDDTNVYFGSGIVKVFFPYPGATSLLGNAYLSTTTDSAGNLIKATDGSVTFSDIPDTPVFEDVVTLL